VSKQVNKNKHETGGGIVTGGCRSRGERTIPERPAGGDCQGEQRPLIHFRSR
jgi:hypothetical protein